MPAVTRRARRRKVVSLAERRLEPVQAVLNALTMATAEALDGKVRGIAIAMTLDAHCEATVYELGDGGVAPLVLACERLKLRLLDEGS